MSNSYVNYDVTTKAKHVGGLLKVETYCKHVGGTLKGWYREPHVAYRDIDFDFKYDAVIANGMVYAGFYVGSAFWHGTHHPTIQMIITKIRLTFTGLGKYCNNNKYSSKLKNFQDVPMWGSASQDNNYMMDFSANTAIGIEGFSDNGKGTLKVVGDDLVYEIPITLYSRASDGSTIIATSHWITSFGTGDIPLFDNNTRSAHDVAQRDGRNASLFYSSPVVLHFVNGTSDT